MDDEKDLEEDSYAPSNSEAQQSETQQPEKSVESHSEDDSKEELMSDGDEEEDTEALEEVEDIENWDEMEIINSPLFAKEFQSAIDHISSIAKDHRVEMLESARKSFAEETGTTVSDEMVSRAMKTFAVLAEKEVSSADETAEKEEESMDEEEKEESLDEELLAEEMEEALSAVRELAQSQRSDLVDTICSIYGELNDEEPTADELVSVFQGIRSSFLDEATLSVSESEAVSVGGDEVDAESLADQMEEALSCVRKQAQIDQEELVDFVWSIHSDLNGSEPSAEDIASIFGRIREQFAADAREEFLERNEENDSDSDRDYSEESSYSEDGELDIYVSGDDDAASSAESERWDEMDDEYDAEEDDAEEYWNDVVDDEELDLWASGIEEWSGSAMSTDDEEQLVASSLFAAEWSSAIEHIEDLAKRDQQSMLSAVWGSDDEATSSMVEEAMDSVAAAVVQYESSDDAAPSELDEWAEALQSARDLGAVHREHLAERISDLFFEENGYEMDGETLSAVFGDLRECLAEEAMASDLDDEDATEHPEAFEAEWSEAIDHVQSIAKDHQQEFVCKISAIYDEENYSLPTIGALSEIFDVVRESLANEAMDELLESDLDFEHSDDAEDSDYSAGSTASDQYAFDALDDAIWNDSASSSALSDDSFDAENDAAEFQECYAEDAEDDLAASSEDEQSAAEEQSESAVAADDAVEAEESKQSEMESDSEYNPDGDSFDYSGDYAAEMASSSSSAVSSESEGGSASDSAVSREDDVLFDYDPDYDLADYSGDFETFDESESFEADLIENSLSEEQSESDQESSDSPDEDDEDYSAGKDDHDYSQDIEDDLAEETEGSNGSGSEDNADKEVSV